MRMMTTHNSKRRKILHSFYISVILCMIFSCGDHRYPQQLLTADSLTEVNPDSAVALLRQLSPQMQDERKAVRMYHRLLTVKAADKADQLQPVPDSILPIVKYYEGRGDKRLLPTAYYYAGRTYYELHDAPQALDYFQKAAEVAGEDWNLEGCIYSNIGHLFLYQGLYEKMYETFNKEYLLSRQANDTVGMIYGLRDMATAIEANNDHQKALDLLKTAHSLAIQSGNLSLRLNIETALSNQHKYIGNYDKAIQYIQAPLSHIDLMNKSAVYSTAVSIYKRIGEADSLRFYAEYIKHKGDVYAKDSVYKFLTQLAIKDKNIDSIRHYFDLYLSYEDSLREITWTNEVAKVNSLYDYQQREKEIALLTIDNEKKRFFLYLACITLIILTALFFISYQRLKKRKERVGVMLQYSEQLKKADANLVDSGIKERSPLSEWVPKDIQVLNSTMKNDILIKQSSIYDKFQNMAQENATPSDEEWNKLEEFLNDQCNSFSTKIKLLFNLSVQDFRMCLLLRIKMNPQKIANLLHVDKTSVSSQRRRLFKRYTGKNGGAKDWDTFICSL